MTADVTYFGAPTGSGPLVIAALHRARWSVFYRTADATIYFLQLG